MRVISKIFIPIFIVSNFSCALFASNPSPKTLDSLRLEIDAAALPLQKVNNLIQASKIAVHINLFDEALELSKTALDIAISEKYKKEQVQAMVEIARAYSKLNDNKRAFKYATQAKDLAEINSYNLEFSYASLLLSKIFFIIGEYDKSIELSYATLEEFEKVKDYKELCDALNMIGINYIENNNDSLAKKYLTQAIDIGKAHNLYSELGTSISNLATIYGNNNESLVAIEIQKQACDILYNHIKESPNLVIGYYNIFNGYIKLNEPDSAFVYLKKLETSGLTVKNSRNAAIVHMGLAEYYNRNKNYEKFLEQCYHAFAIAKENDLKIFQLKTARLLEMHYLKNNIIDSAYKYKNIQFELNKEINSQNISTKLAQFEIKKELEILEKERIFQQHKKTLYIIIVLITMLSLLVLLLVLLLRYRIKVRYSILKQQKLTDEIYYKNKESTVSLIELMKKNELLADVTKELLKVSRSAQKPEFKNTINKIALKIENITKEKIWEEFSVSFQQVHSNFYKNLTDKYPDLTSNEQRLCAFLKLNLSTKEISSITGQSERALVMARHRLRKKMGIQSQDTNLSSFIATI